MKFKVIAALMMTVVMTLAAFASEQRRMCQEVTVTNDQPVLADDVRETTVIAMNVDAAN